MKRLSFENKRTYVFRSKIFKLNSILEAELLLMNILSWPIIVILGSDIWIVVKTSLDS